MTEIPFIYIHTPALSLMEDTRGLKYFVVHSKNEDKINFRGVGLGIRGRSMPLAKNDHLIFRNIDGFRQITSMYLYQTSIK